MNINQRLLEFIRKSPCCFQAAETLRERLLSEGFRELSEKERWNLKPGNYFVLRNHSALIAFSIPEKAGKGFHIAASHSDSPSFKIKENPEMLVEGHYVTLNVEKYGGMLCAPWFDRPLSAAGRIFLQGEAGPVERLVDLDRDALLIPNVAIHMNRKANEGYAYNPQVDMIPLFGLEEAKGGFMKLVAEAAGVKPEDILSHDLFLYNRTPGTIWGSREEFVSAPRLDDLQCAFGGEASLQSSELSQVSAHASLSRVSADRSGQRGAERCACSPWERNRRSTDKRVVRRLFCRARVAKERSGGGGDRR